jgi:hypothetical protein
MNVIQKADYENVGNFFPSDVCLVYLVIWGVLN